MGPVLRLALSWRSLVVFGYLAWALVCSFVFGGGLTVLAFFAIWGAVWLVYSVFWRWADARRQLLLRGRGSS